MTRLPQRPGTAATGELVVAGPAYRLPAMRGQGWIKAGSERDGVVLQLGGDWLIRDAAALDAKVSAYRAPSARRFRLDLREVGALDTAGAWLVLRLERKLAERGAAVSLENLAPDLQPLLAQVEKRPVAGSLPPPPPRRSSDELAFIGAQTVDAVRTAGALVGFLGVVVVTALRALRHPARIRLISVVANMERTGVSALPIIGLLSFLIGIVMAYQGADQLRQFGAQIYTVNLLGVSFLRELGVLLTAIIVAGRSGSAFTAEIGTMQVNEEVDALRTLGINPVEVLVLPRLFALILTLPLLAFYANVMGIVGGALMCWAELGIPLSVFLEQLRGAIYAWTFWLGIIKAPFFAVCIALIGCYEGLRVERSAESVGRLTTRAVVESIFLVIVVDAAFSILFSKLGI